MKIEALTGSAILPAIPALAELRIRVFAEWPYLYDGDVAYEEDYLRAFAASEDAVLVLARDGERIVGASTGSPMAAQEREIREPVEAFGFDTSEVFYFGESVLLPDCRGQGIGHAFFDQREAHARACGARYAAFASVIRPDDHPARPESYRPLDSFWLGRGYAKVNGLTCHIAWRDHGEAAESPKSLQFWMREL
ncbi:GNAT family N-acetyltransferase [Altererythrobacter sp. BO-6]|uniref:GNAT family N-acetyltransferase n=1 Tax=Altererythrobacter sp. BO-6 TaxID=2604537 RepID=UPI0013E190B1|nr:GNAT family N-acetyltransferase [Altererythrobacter sp. BO-6]QIG54953.1 GNAT family N-acetyltransferase [Altererythrobacter sp. BO-6]